MIHLLLIVLSAEAGGFLAVVNGHLALGLLVVGIGSQAAARCDDAYDRRKDGHDGEVQLPVPR